MGACGGRLKGKWVVGSSHALSRSLLKRWTDRSVDAISAAAVSVLCRRQDGKGIDRVFSFVGLLFKEVKGVICL